MTLPKLSILFLFLYASISVHAQTTPYDCKYVGNLPTFYDPDCFAGGIGCNAGGQNEHCRFCGFDNYVACPTATTVASVTTTPIIGTNGNTNPTVAVTTAKPAVTVSPVVVQAVCKDKEDAPPGTLIFYDEFDTFNLNTWKHDLTMSGGGNWEFQLYHNNRSNSFVKNSVLHLKPTLTENRIGEANLKNGYRMDMWGGSPVDQCTGNNFYGCERTSGAGGNILPPIQSAKITTVESFSFRYGKVEIRAQLPKGDWLWPAIWLLPKRNAYGIWPASGEIDIMESRGNAHYPASAEGGTDSFGSTLHWGVDWSQNRYTQTHSVYKHPSKLSDGFHIYGLHWTEDRLFTYIDNESNIVLDVDLKSKPFYDKGQFPKAYDNPWLGAGNAAPFNEEFYLIMNVAVGGTAGFFPDNVDNKPWSDKSPNAVNEFYSAKNAWLPTWSDSADSSALKVDYIKIWQL